jgi:ubiquitin conjugation factor E4 B
MAGLFKLIWNSPVHKEALKIEAQFVRLSLLLHTPTHSAHRKGDRFVKFVNLMIGDVTYLMDESLSDMSQIHAIQTEMADTERWAAAPAEHKREREKALRQLERMASGYCELARATVALLRIFTADARAPFMLPEIAPRLAAMLDYNLDALVGPRCAGLKVADPAKYSFDPRALLKDFVAIFLNLAPEDAFVRAVAQDGRSYRAELFARAGDVCTRRGLKSPAEVDALAAFTRAVEAMKATIEAEEDLGDVPDEFTDPLLATLMRDPVILPSSRAVVDRATIRGYLLSETRDPFNRQPLTIDMVVPGTHSRRGVGRWTCADRCGRCRAQGEDRRVAGGAPGGEDGHDVDRPYCNMLHWIRYVLHLPSRRTRARFAPCLRTLTPSYDRICITCRPACYSVRQYENA